MDWHTLRRSATDGNARTDRNDRNAYCLCLHVKPATIFVALVNLGGSLICAIITLALLSYDSSYMSESQRSRTTTLAIVIYMLLASVSAMLLYGVLKSRPTYILPFFAIQFIDFLFTLPHFLASLYTQPVIYDNNWNNRYSHSYLEVRNAIWPNSASVNAYTSSLLFTTLVVLFKCYFLCVVWKCYRYLRLKEMILPLQMPYHHNIANELIVPQIMVPPPHYDEAVKNIAPPDYETAIKGDNSKASSDKCGDSSQQQSSCEQRSNDLSTEAEHKSTDNKHESQESEC